MFIVGDENKINDRISWVTFFLVAVNVAVFAAEIYLGEPFIQGFTLVPKEITTLQPAGPASLKSKSVPIALQDRSGRQVASEKSGRIRVYEYTAPVGGRGMSLGPVRILLTLLTHMFLHGSWLHLIGNMWFLAMFGRNVEAALGHFRFLIFYFACGVAAALVYTVSDASSVMPCLGASGAISGIMGAYFAILPFNLILVYLGPFGIVPLPCFLVVGIWFVFQYIPAMESLEVTAPRTGGVAYWAHVGGFLAGIVIMWALIICLNLRNGLRQKLSGRRSGPEEVCPSRAAESYQTSLSSRN